MPSADAGNGQEPSLLAFCLYHDVSVFCEVLGESRPILNSTVRVRILTRVSKPTHHRRAVFRAVWREFLQKYLEEKHQVACELGF